MEGRSPRDFIFKILLLKEDFVKVFYGWKVSERRSLSQGGLVRVSINRGSLNFFALKILQKAFIKSIPTLFYSSPSRGPFRGRTSAGFPWRKEFLRGP